MGSVGETYGIIRYVEPDLSVPARDRAFFANPAPKRLEEIEQTLHDMRTSKDIARGVEGLDVQGFTYLHSPSSLSGEQMLEGTNAEDIYGPETLNMMLKFTGAKKGICHSVGFRLKPADKQKDLSFVPMRGAEIDQIMAGESLDGILVNGKIKQFSSEPARQVHVDMTYEGLKRTVREARQDIREMAKHVIQAEDLRAAGHNVRIPRYASYSIWRPLKPVKRDPLAVLDIRTIDKSELVRSENRIPSSINLQEGDYTIEAYTASPPRYPERQRWYWLPEQQPDEALIFKFADSAAQHDLDGDLGIAECCPHVSPVLLGTEDEDPRESVECRVYLFWD